MFLVWTVPGSLVPLYSYHLEELGFNRLTIALCCATQAIAGVVASLFAGHVADRWIPAERIMLFCAGLAGLDLWLLAELSDPWAVFLATLVFWLLNGPMLLMCTTISFTHLPSPERQFGPIRLWGTMGWMIMGWMISGWLARPQWLEPLFGWVHPQIASAPLVDAFRLGGCMAFVVICYALTLPHTPPRPRGDEGEGHHFAAEVLQLFHSKAFVLYAVCVLCMSVTFPFTTQNTPILLKQLGLPQHRVAQLLPLAQITEIASLAILPLLLRLLTVRGAMIFGLCAWLVAMSVLAVGAPLELVVSSMFLNGLYVTGFLIAGQIYVNELATDEVRASAQGLLSGVISVGLLIGNLLAGGLREYSHGAAAPPFVVAAAITALVLLLILLGFRQHQPDATDDEPLTTRRSGVASATPRVGSSPGGTVSRTHCPARSPL